MRSIYIAVMLLLSVTMGTPGQDAPDTANDAFPFAVGETLVYRASLGRFGGSGRGVMRIERLEDVRGATTYLLHSDLQGRVLGMKAEDHTRSWLDPVRMVSLRFSKEEDNPIRSFNEEVELFPERRRWTSAEDSGDLDTDAPLDELSFIYFVRTLPLRDGDEYTFARHYDPLRNPTRVRVVGREQITVPAGEFQVIVVEMRVRDTRRYDGEGTVRLHLTDDERRIPVRIASRMRLVGSTVLSLEFYGSSTIATR